jgi:RNA polymerase sigma-70 factor (ECF subfamily)
VTGERTSEDGADDVVAQPASMTADEPESEAALAAALGRLDPEAWSRLFHEQYRRIFRYAYVRTGSAPDAEDIASNVFAEAVRGIGRFRFRGVPVSAWLIRIAHHETVDVLRRRKRAASAPIDAAGSLVAPDVIAREEERRRIAEAMGRLKAEHRVVLTLRLIDGRSIAEVAQALGKSAGAVKMSQARALEALRRELDR